jgi:hypothetical protein
MIRDETLFIAGHFHKILFAVIYSFWEMRSGLYYKHTTIVYYASSIVNELEALLTDDARVIIYDRHVFIVQVTNALM